MANAAIVGTNQHWLDQGTSSFSASVVGGTLYHGIVLLIVNILIEILGRHIERRLDIGLPAIDLPDQEVRI